MKIAITGAGIGGLCLAQALVRNGIDVTVYERDAALDSRDQGYRIHLDAGRALHACLPPDLYQLCIATSGHPSTEINVVTRRLRQIKRLASTAPADLADPETLSTSVNRRTFREILAARLEIHYDMTCTGFEQHEDSVSIAFEDGSRAEADVLVGADGVASRVRNRYLPHARIRQTGEVCVYGRTPLTPQVRPLIPDYTWRGFTAVVGSGIGMATGVLDFREPPQDAAARIAPDVKLTAVPGYLMWALTGPARKFAEDPAGTPEHLHAIAARTIRRWHPDLRRLVGLAAVEDTALVTIRTAEPVGPWRPTRVTVLGDAIHAMSPSRGSGANIAIRDAALLAAELTTSGKPVTAAIGDYERQMTSYAWAAVRAAQA